MEKKKSGKKKIIIIIAAVAVIGALVGVSIIARNKNANIEVTGYKVIADDFVREITANGEITSKENTKIYAAVEAAVNRVPVEEGQLVAKDQLLIMLDRESLDNKLIKAENAVVNLRMSVRSELLNLRSAYSKALTAEAQAERDLKLARELHKISSISDEELRTKEEAFVIAEENLDFARQKLNFREGRELNDDRSRRFKSDSDIVEDSPEVVKALSDLDIAARNVKYYEIKAETGGTITDLNVDENSVVEVGNMLAEIHDETSLIVDALIDEVDLSYIALGQEVKIKSDSFIGTDLPGRVSYIAPMIKKVSDSRGCEIKVDLLENPDKIARIGASSSIYITVDKKDGVPAIPVESYFIDSGKKYVWKLIPEEGFDEKTAEYFTVRKTEVKTGILGIDTIEISSGLSRDDLIVENRVPGLSDGMQVSMIMPEKESADSDGDSKNGR